MYDGDQLIYFLMRCNSVRVSSVLSLCGGKGLICAFGILRFLYFLVPVCGQSVQTKHTKSKTYN